MCSRSLFCCVYRMFIPRWCTSLWVAYLRELVTPQLVTQQHPGFSGYHLSCRMDNERLTESCQHAEAVYKDPVNPISICKCICVHRREFGLQNAVKKHMHFGSLKVKGEGRYHGKSFHKLERTQKRAMASFFKPKSTCSSHL